MSRLEAILEIGILLAATWPAIRFLSIPSIRREFAGIAAGVTGLLVLHVVAIALLALFAPVLLRFAAVLAAIALAAERWRARSDHGARHRLPPGSLTIVPRQPWIDHLFYLKQAQRFGPIFKISLLHRPLICIHGAKLGSALFRQYEEVLEAPPVRFNSFIPGGFLRYMAPSDHRTYKPLLQTALSPAVLRANEDAIAHEVHGTFTGLVASEAVDPTKQVELRSELRDMFFRILAWLLFAIPADSEEKQRLQTLYDALDIRKMSLIPSHQDRRALEAIVELIRERGNEIAATLADGGTPPSCALTALLSSNPQALSDETLMRNLIYILQIGRADLTGLAMWTFKQLGDHPQWQTRLVENARTSSDEVDPSLPLRILKETLRLEQSEYVYRRAKRDIEFQDFVIPQGWRIRVLIREGHRDPALFENPEHFDPDRFLAGRSGGGRFAPFGLGAHACIGVPVTETVMAITLSELGRSFDWRVLEDGPREYGWAHWQPSSKLRLAFYARPEQRSR